MAIYTPNYNLSKPESTDTQASLVSAYRDNMDIIDKQMGNKNIAEEYDNTQTYDVDDYVIYEGDLYKCTTAVTTAEDFDPTKWTQTIVTDELGGGGSGGHTIIDENDTEVAQEPSMQFTGKVEVTDDSINEKTVVEVLPEVVEVTLAEYIALGDVVNTDGKLYCITDLNNSNVQGYPPLIYSDEEREVGVWRDGKPLYQITINIGQLTLDTNFHVISHNISNIDEVVDIKAIMMLETSPYRSYPLPIGRSNTSPNQNVLISVNSTEIQYMNNWQSNTHVVYVTFQYTKTTDTAGSGIWNGQGGYAHHYSTSEKVIGTWIDGKPLYEITSRITQDLSLTANTWVKSQFDQGTKKALYKTMIVNDSGAVIDNVAGGFVDNKIAINSPRTLTVLANTGYLIMQYTKTTD